MLPYAQIRAASLYEQLCFATDSLKTVDEREIAILVDWLGVVFK